ncbi:MAG TPA: hypothetical protein VHF89_20785, partial [Solirubrobacteraceae bacterium]|nr:hypothetical protein [Solirubrobacteraceae bacterium]
MPFAVLLIVLLLVPASASAQVPGQAPNPSIDQYVESVPTTKGSRYTRGGDRERPAELPPGVERRLERRAGADAQALKDIATSRALGAPAAGSPGGATARG